MKNTLLEDFYELLLAQSTIIKIKMHHFFVN